MASLGGSTDRSVFCNASPVRPLITSHVYPAVSGSWIKKDPGGAPARAFFDLVGPAAVIGHRLATEPIRVLDRRFTGQHQQDLAGHVHITKIIPAFFGGADPVADKDDLAGDVEDILWNRRPRHEVASTFEIELGGLREAMK